MVSHRLLKLICKQRTEFAQTKALQAPLKNIPFSVEKYLVPCGWFSKKDKSYTKCNDDDGSQMDECKKCLSQNVFLRVW